MVQAKHPIGRFAKIAVCLIVTSILIACDQQSNPTVTSTSLPTETNIERNTPETILDSTATTESMPTLAGVVFSHDESLWQINQEGNPVKLLDSFPGSYYHGSVSWDSKRIIFKREKQLWVVDLVSGERNRIAIDSRPLSCFRWVQGQSSIAYYAFKPSNSRDFEHYPITMTVAHFASDSLEILEEKQFSEVSRFASMSPDGYRLAYHDGDGAWIIQSDHPSEPFDTKEYGVTVPPDAILTNPAWSPDGSHIAWAISGAFDGKYQTTLVVFDLSSKTFHELHQYDAIEGAQSIQWRRPQMVWSPDNNWIAFDAGDAAFSADGGVWVFGLDEMQKRRIRSRSLIGWSWDSKHLCHRFKDYSGCVGVPDWEEHRLTPLPFNSWGFLSWTKPVESK